MVSISTKGRQHKLSEQTNTVSKVTVSELNYVFEVNELDEEQDDHGIDLRKYTTN